MQQLYYAIVLAAFIVSLSLIFVKTAEKYGLAKAVIALMITADVFTVMLLVLGIDRPLFIITTRVGSLTVTALMMFLIVKIPFTIWTIAKSSKLQRVLG